MSLRSSRGKFISVSLETVDISPQEPISGRRLGVLDVGSNTIHLLVVDAHRGAAPIPATSHKEELRLTEFLLPNGAISRAGRDLLLAAIQRAVAAADPHGPEELLAFATSALREAANGDEILAEISQECGIDLEVLSGGDEARLTFLAVRRWFGWSSGRLLVLDIGGGSLEVACGTDEDPEEAFSLPLGASRLTAAHLKGDPFDSGDIKNLRRLVRSSIAEIVPEILRLGSIDHPVATSKTFRSLSRLCGAEPSTAGPLVPRLLKRDVLEDWLPRIFAMTTHERAKLPGVSISRANQLVAGAIVAHTAMDLLDIEALEICPWALREGIILRRLDWLNQ